MRTPRNSVYFLQESLQSQIFNKYLPIIQFFGQIAVKQTKYKEEIRWQWHQQHLLMLGVQLIRKLTYVWYHSSVSSQSWQQTALTLVPTDLRTTSDKGCVKNWCRVTRRPGRRLTQHFVSATCCRFLKAIQKPATLSPEFRIVAPKIVSCKISLPLRQKLSR